jgi:hypothetical protein
MLTVRTRDCSRLQISSIPEGVAKHPPNRISIPAANEVIDGFARNVVSLPASRNCVRRKIALLEIGDQGHVCTHRECVALGCADHAPVFSPVNECVAAIGRGRHRIRSAPSKCSAACNRAVGNWRGTDLHRETLRGDDQGRGAGRDLIVGCIVEIDVADVGANRESVRRGWIDSEGDRRRPRRHCSRSWRCGEPARHIGD